jgi:DNA transformation protein and related proteins
MEELMGDMPGVTSRAMFGGWGIYKDGVIFAIIADGRLYFKVGSGNQQDFESRGSESFMYQMPNGKKTTMSYRELPEEIAENKNELVGWIDKSVAEHKKKK